MHKVTIILDKRDGIENEVLIKTARVRFGIYGDIKHVEVDCIDNEKAPF